jgi:glycosyltransferase involved in cell wall biosynthesis
VKITHISTWDISGGAARAAYRLHAGLRRLGHESMMFVKCRDSDDPSVIGFRYPIDILSRARRVSRRWLLKRQISERQSKRSPTASYFTDDRTEHLAAPLRQMPLSDVIHLHWVAGFLDYQDFFSHVPTDRPIVWTLHDMNPFTGGCHYDEACGRFANACGACPQLSSKNPNDFSRSIWQRKRRAYRFLTSGNPHLATPSKWLASEAQKSSLFRGRSVSVIPYGLDTEVFQPRDRHAARDVLGMRQDDLIILFVADGLLEARKGLRLLQEALNSLSNTSNLCLAVLGRGPLELLSHVRMVRSEYTKDDRVLSMIYSAADIFVLPALQDNFPNTALEALACGLPAVAFNIGGVPEIVRDGCTGVLVEPATPEALASAIEELVGHPERRKEMSANCRRVAVEEYALKIQARRYLELYESILSKQTRPAQAIESLRP